MADEPIVPEDETDEKEVEEGADVVPTVEGDEENVEEEIAPTEGEDPEGDDEEDEETDEVA